MSSSKPYVTAGKASEKKNFTQACNLLNQYLKEKGNLRDLNINGKLESTGRSKTTPASTVDFLTSMENPSPAAITTVRISPPSPPPEKSSPPLPQYIDVETYIVGGGKASSSSKPATVEAKTKTAAMTIFYGGHVMMFNDFSEEKAREIMLLATTGGDRIDRGKAPVTSPANSIPIITAQEANGSDLPIARRASLHKFLAKRKDRATARAAPYQLTTSFQKDDEPKLDLNL